MSSNQIFFFLYILFLSLSFINYKSPMKVIILTSLLLVCSLGFTISNIVTDDGRVKVDFYYESLCPYCQQFMERSLKVASQTKVNFMFYSRISGKSVTSTFILMEMPKESKMEPAGVLLANMEWENVKAILSRPVRLRNTTFTLKPFHSSFVLRITPTIGLQVEKNALRPTTWTGMRFIHALPQLKELNTLWRWPRRLNLSTQFILTFHGLW